MNLPPGFHSKDDEGMVWRSRAAFPGWLIVAGLVVVLSSYFIYMPQQPEVEGRFAQMVARHLKYHPYEDRDIPLTNTLQALQFPKRSHPYERSYPYDWHEWFRNFGDSAGFARSLEEKYVFAPAGVDLRGEVYLLSAQTYLRGWRAVRTIITRHQDDYSYSVTPEYLVQEAFQKAGKAIPAPPVAAAPPPPPGDFHRSTRGHYLSTWLETRGWFSQLEWHGMNPRTARLCEGIVFGGILLVALGGAAYCLWPVCVPRHEGESNVLLPATTAGKLWTLAGATFALFFFFFLPSVGSDRGFSELYFNLVSPYLGILIGLGASLRYVAPVVLLMQIIIYNFVLGYFWTKNQLAFPALMLALVHTLAIALCVLMWKNRFDW